MNVLLNLNVDKNYLAILDTYSSMYFDEISSKLDEYDEKFIHDWILDGDGMKNNHRMAS